MASKRTLDKLANAIADLEIQDSPPDEYDRMKASSIARVRSMLEFMFHPRHVSGFSDQKRRLLWPAWELLRLFSTLSYTECRNVEAAAFEVETAILTLQVKCDAFLIESTEPGAWVPINPATLADIRFRVRFDCYGKEEKAKRIDHIFELWPPWVREFNSDSSTWPAEAIERIKAGGSWPPDEVPEFDWREIEGYMWRHPFPRNLDGSPTAEVLTDTRPIELPRSYPDLFHVVCPPSLTDQEAMLEGFPVGTFADKALIRTGGPDLIEEADE